MSGTPLEVPETPPAASIAVSDFARSRRHRNPELWKLLERIVLALLVTAFAVTGFLPGWRHLNSDFPNYYLAAKLYWSGYPLDRVYDWTWLQREKDHRGIDQGLVTFSGLTPPSALVAVPLASLSPLSAKRVWLLVNLVFLVLIAILLARMSALGWERVGLLMFLSIQPLRANFILGQQHVLVLLLLTLAAWLYFRKSYSLAGISLGIGAALKIYPGLFLIYFLFKRQWRAAGGVIVGLASTGLLSLLVFGKQAWEVYVREILPASFRGETIDPYSVVWGSLASLLRRLFIVEPELNPAPVAHLPWLYALLQSLAYSVLLIVFLWATGLQKGDGSKAKRDWAIYLYLLLFLSSQASSYHFVALILTAVLVIDSMMAQGQHTLARVVTGFYFLICAATIQMPGTAATPAGWMNLLFFPRLALMGGLGAILLLWMLVSATPESLRAHFSARAILVAGSAVIVLAAASFFSTRRHLSQQFGNYGSRLITVPESIFVSDPVVTLDSVLATTMVRGGYTIRRLQAGSVLDFPRTSGDWLHPAATEQPGLIWAELASKDGSRIMRFSNGASSVDPTTETSDAETPIVSRDGLFLAFVREVKGRSSLWIKSLAPTSGESQAVEHQVAGAEYDVYDAAFTPDHRLLFSSRRSGRFALYAATLDGKVERLSRPECSARYPSESPDGHMLAFSCEQKGYWQLHLAPLAGNQDSQLTSGECNSTSPVWTPDSKHLIYASDCGRGVGMPALAEINLVP